MASAAAASAALQPPRANASTSDWIVVFAGALGALMATLDISITNSALPQIQQARAAHPALDKMLVMREELRQLWLNTTHSREQLTADLQAWCRRAEESGIAALREFSIRLRAAHA